MAACGRPDLDIPPGVAAGLTVAGAERRALFTHTAQRIEKLLDEVAEGPVTPAADPAEIRRALAPFDFAAPRQAEEVVDACAEWLGRWTTHVTHPRYFGLFNPKPATVAIAADALVAAVNPQLATWTHAPAAVEIERHAIGFLGARLGLPGDAVSGSFTSGGAEANHTGLLLSLTRAFPRFVAEGVRALPGQPLIYASSEAHAAIVRIAQACGLGGRLDQRRRDRPALGASRLLPRRRSAAPRGRRLGGRAGALGSLTTPAHRDRAGRLDHTRCAQVAVGPMGAGVFICTDEAGLEETFALATPYMPPAGAGADPFRISMQWSRRSIGLKLFATLAVAGRPRFEELIERQIALGDHLRAVARRSGWEIANPTPLPVVCLAHPEVHDYDRLAADVIARGAWAVCDTARRACGRSHVHHQHRLDEGRRRSDRRGARRRARSRAAGLRPVSSSRGAAVAESCPRRSATALQRVRDERAATARRTGRSGRGAARACTHASAALGGSPLRRTGSR